MIKIFNHYFHKRTLAHLVFDLGLIVVVLVGFLLQRSSATTLGTTQLLGVAMLLACAILVVNSGLGFYQHHQTLSPKQIRIRALLSLCLCLPLAYAVFVLSPLQAQDAATFLLALLCAMALMLAYRIHIARATPGALLRQRVLIYGTGQTAQMVARLLRQSDPGIELVGYYAGPNEPDPKPEQPGLSAPKLSLTEVVQKERVDEIVVALGERRGGSMPMRELLDCKLHGVRVMDVATHFEKTLGQIRRDAVSAGWLIFSDGFAQGPVRSAIKRLFDIVCALVLIALSWPIMAIACVLIWLEDRGPVLYFQERVGLNGRLFNVVKFRSMRTDAESDGRPCWARAADSRVTRVGRWIRKLRIDELPQLFCVLAGEMSMVGPRPERPYFVDRLTQELPYYAVRHSVKPGVTGWAQVRYHYGASVEDSAEKLQYDLYYVKNHTLLLDLIVLFETVGVVLTGKGAQ